VAIAELDLFTHVARAGSVDVAELCAEWHLDARPVDVMLTYFAALGLLERNGDATVRLSPLASEHLVAGSPLDLRAYFASLRERPGCAELSSVLRTGRPADWAGATGARNWEERLAEADFAATFTAAMDARAAFLGPALAARSRTSRRGASWMSQVARAPMHGPSSTGRRTCGRPSSSAHRSTRSPGGS